MSDYENMKKADYEKAGKKPVMTPMTGGKTSMPAPKKVPTTGKATPKGKQGKKV